MSCYRRRGHTLVATNKTPLAKRRRTQRFLRSSARTHALSTFIDLISFALRTGQGLSQKKWTPLKWTPIMYTCATMAYSIQLQTTLTGICGVQKQEKSIQTSNKNISWKNIKGCEPSKKYQNKVGMPFGPHSALTIRTMLWVQSV